MSRLSTALMRASSSRRSKGLGHVVVSAHLEADDLVHRIAAAGHDDQPAAPVFAQLAGDRKAVFAGQPQVEQHQGRRIGAHHRHQQLAVVHPCDSKAVAVRVVRQQQ